MLNHIGTYTGLGFFVPTGFVNAIEQATKWFAPLLDGSVITVMDTATGQPLPFPTSNDTTNAATIVDEAGHILSMAFVDNMFRPDAPDDVTAKVFADEILEHLNVVYDVTPFSFKEKEGTTPYVDVDHGFYRPVLEKRK